MYLGRWIPQRYKIRRGSSLKCVRTIWNYTKHICERLDSFQVTEPSDYCQSLRYLLGRCSGESVYKGYFWKGLIGGVDKKSSNKFNLLELIAVEIQSIVEKNVRC